MCAERESFFMGVCIPLTVRLSVKVLTMCREYESVFSALLSGEATTPSVVTSRTRRNFAQDLYYNCIRCDRTAGRSSCSQNATWFSVLRATVRHTGVKAMNKNHWIGALTVAMLVCESSVCRVRTNRSSATGELLGWWDQLPRC